MAVGIPTSTSHGKPMIDLLGEFNGLLVTLERVARENRILMAASSVSDEIIKTVWERFAYCESRLLEIRRTPDFHDEYARFRGLSYAFNCTDDVNAATDKIINLPVNHRFKTNHRVDFKINEGALPGALAEGTNYFIRTVDTANGTVTLTTVEDGTTDFDLTNATGNAEMILNIKPDLSTLITAVDDVLDEIEVNLAQRAPTYDRPNLSYTFSTRTTVETASLRTKLSTVEGLIDVVEA